MNNYKFLIYLKIISVMVKHVISRFYHILSINMIAFAYV